MNPDPEGDGLGWTDEGLDEMDGWYAMDPTTAPRMRAPLLTFPGLSDGTRTCAGRPDMCRVDQHTTG